ncbi:MAG: hypothetical protein KTR14_09360 [Vampirovibrio sp.]|nr:hypothetical protein [Vampirovibrio sp.]
MVQVDPKRGQLGVRKQEKAPSIITPARVANFREETIAAIGKNIDTVLFGDNNSFVDASQYIQIAETGDLAYPLKEWNRWQTRDPYENINRGIEGGHLKLIENTEINGIPIEFHGPVSDRFVSRVKEVFNNMGAGLTRGVEKIKIGTDLTSLVPRKFPTPESNFFRGQDPGVAGLREGGTINIPEHQFRKLDYVDLYYQTLNDVNEAGSLVSKDPTELMTFDNTPAIDTPEEQLAAMQSNASDIAENTEDLGEQGIYTQSTNIYLKETLPHEVAHTLVDHPSVNLILDPEFQKAFRKDFSSLTDEQLKRLNQASLFRRRVDPFTSETVNTAFEQPGMHDNEAIEELVTTLLAGTEAFGGSSQNGSFMEGELDEMFPTTVEYLEAKAADLKDDTPEQVQLQKYGTR